VKNSEGLLILSYVIVLPVFPIFSPYPHPLELRRKKKRKRKIDRRKA